MRLNIYFFFALVTFIFGCSKDNEPQIETGNIEITVLIRDNNIPVFDAVISINSISREQTTGIEGNVLFNDIEVGSYEVSTIVPFSNIPVKQTVDVENNKTTNVIILIDGPNIITPAELDIDKWLDASFISLVTDNIFGASGYASIWGDIGSDILTASGSNALLRNLDTYNFNANDKSIENIWINHYKVISKANKGIEAVESSEFTTELNTDANFAKAQFKFLRALTYFNLIKLFGNPVLVTSTDISIINNPVIQDPLKTYGVIEEDLIFAENNLEASNIKNRASKSAAQALLGKVYLQMAGFPLLQNDKYAKALEQFSKLDGKYTLETNYKSNFEAEKVGTNNEIIFAIDFNVAENPDSWNWNHWGPLDVNEKDFYLLTTGFIESYFKSSNDLTSPVKFPLNTEDSRFFENIASFKIQNDVSANAQNINDWRSYKFSENYQEGKSFYLPYLRYADVLLMIAEAENAINGKPMKL